MISRSFVRDEVRTPGHGPFRARCRRESVAATLKHAKSLRGSCSAPRRDPTDHEHTWCNGRIVARGVPPGSRGGANMLAMLGRGSCSVAGVVRSRMGVVSSMGHGSSAPLPRDHGPWRTWPRRSGLVSWRPMHGQGRVRREQGHGARVMERSAWAGVDCPAGPFTGQFASVSAT